MCGLAGVYSKEGREGLYCDSLINSSDTLRHRGPDQLSSWESQSGKVAFLHARLSIIDLSETGSQPMVSRDGRYTLAFNGEIYNYLELKSLLKNREQLKGSSDTEVFLSLISERGLKETLKLSNGMFAFALWDNHKDKLYLVRDRVGEKPLYYKREKRAIIFSSEINSIRKISIETEKIEDESLYLYLSLGFIPSPKTAFKDLYEVPPGTILEFDSDNVIVDRYWCLEDSLVESRNSFKEVVNSTWELIKEGVKIRLRSDVELGCFLSGGIDSGLLVAAASNYVGKVKTFTSTVPSSPKTNESTLAKLTAIKYETEHIELPISFDIKDELANILNRFGQPFADPSAIPTYFLMREARKYVKVVLNGEGADELFCGYRRSIAYRLFEVIKRYSKYFGSLEKISSVPSEHRSSYAFFYRFIRGLKLAEPDRYLLWCQDGFSDFELKQLMEKNSRELLTADYIQTRLSSYRSVESINKFLLLDFDLNMHDDMLKKLDICSMTNSIEARSPFLDPNLASYAFSIPVSQRSSFFKNKPILRDLAKRYLPPEVASAPKKGFEIPIHEWLAGPLKDFAVESILTRNSIVGDIFNKTRLQKFLETPSSYSTDQWSKRVWNLLCLSLWK